jgi:hypothetical protein
MAIINSRADLDNAPPAERDTFMVRLAGTIHKWAWQDGQWVLVTDEATIGKFGFVAADFPDAPVPEMPSHNPDAPGPFPRLSRVQFLATLEIDLSKSEAEVEAAIDQLPESTPEEIATKKHARIAFRNAQSFGRNDPVLLAILPLMGLDESAVDTAWRAAPQKY